MKHFQAVPGREGGGEEQKTEAVEARNLISSYQQDQFLLEALEQYLFWASLLDSGGVAGNPLHSLACSCTTLDSAPHDALSVHLCVQISLFL